MLNISINRETGAARLAQSTAIKAGGMVPVRVEFSTMPGDNPVIELALSPQSSERAVLAYLDVFAPENSTTWLGLLDANDERLTTHLATKGVSSTPLDVEVVVFAGGERRVYPNFPVTVQAPTITGPASSEGGPVYLTLAQAESAFVPQDQVATTAQRGIVRLASDGEIQTGTDTGKVVRVSGLAAWWAGVKGQVQTFTQLLAPRMVRTSDFTAAIGGRYIARGTFAVTDPTGTTAGQEYSVVVGSGSVTIGGVAFAPSRFPVVRQYNGATWETLAQGLTGNLSLPTATFGSNNALTGAVGDGRYPVPNLIISSPYVWTYQPPVVSNGAYNLSAAGRSVTSLTRSGTVATAVSAGHGYTTGMRISISGASPGGFNGEYPITVLDGDTWTYELDADPGSDATGTIIAYNHWVQLFRSTGNLGNFLVGEVVVGASAAGSGDHLRFGITGGNTASPNGVPVLLERSGYGWVDTIRCSRISNNGLCVEIRIGNLGYSYVVSSYYRPICGAAPEPDFVGGSPGPIGPGSPHLNCIVGRLTTPRIITVDPPSVAAGSVGSILTANDITFRQVLAGGHRIYASLEVTPVTPLPAGLLLVSAYPEGTEGRVRFTFWNTSGSTIDAPAQEFLIHTTLHAKNI